MATVLNRTTKAYIVSANTPDYPTAQWIIEPDMTAVSGQPSKYWVITGNAVTLMNQAQRDAVDAASVTAQRTAVATLMDGVEGYERAFALVLLDEINALRAQHSLVARTVVQLKTALIGKLGT